VRRHVLRELREVAPVERLRAVAERLVGILVDLDDDPVRPDRSCRERKRRHQRATTRSVSRPFFGMEAVEYRTATRTKLGAMLGIKEYPTPTVPGMFNPLLATQFSFVLTQSFSFLPKPAAQDLLQRQYNRLANVGDLAISQAEELKDALDAGGSRLLETCDDPRIGDGAARRRTRHRLKIT